MQNISRTLKKKRDKEARQRERELRALGYDPTAPVDPHDPADPPTPTDPYEPSEAVKIVREYFQTETEWNFNHGLGVLPILTVWKGDLFIYGYGSQPYGTSPYGGGMFQENFEVATHEPDIIKVDNNNVKITWTGPTSGEVVAIGHGK